MAILDKLVRDLQSGETNTMKIGHLLSKDQVLKTILDQIYPVSKISTKAKFYMYYNDIKLGDVVCDDTHIKRFADWSNGFQKYCGNQSHCYCNRNERKESLNRLNEQDWSRRASKRKKTNLEKYGFEHASQHPDVKVKAENTCIEKYGVKSPTLNNQILMKSSQTCFTNHGVNWPQQNSEILQKTNQNNFQKYGVERPAQFDEFFTKMQNTCLEKYGSINPMGSDEIKDKAVKSRKRTIFTDIISLRDRVTPLFTVDDYVNGDHNTDYDWECKSCLNIFKEKIIPGKNPNCDICYPEYYTWGENLIKTWLDEHNINYEIKVRNIINPYELDFYIKDLDLAIEFNGIYWHSELAGRNKSYHRNKFLMCKNKNIKLIQIFEHELKNKTDIVKNRLLNSLGLNNIKLHARTCNLVELNNSQARTFFNASHLHGHQNSKYIYSLTDKKSNEILAVMSFAKTRFSKKYEYELLRFATKPGVTLRGAASKLFAHAKNKIGFKTAVSYADLNWGLGNVYENLGFKLSHYSKPNYWYFQSLDDVKSRVGFQKHKLPKELSYLGSEWEIMKYLGYNRYWDTGNAVWIYQS